MARVVAGIVACVVAVSAFAALAVPLGLPPLPGDTQATPAMVSLGRTLFFDKRLSGDGSVSCASCHVPERGFSDGMPVSRGIGGHLGTRNDPSLLNVAYERTLFWDGRSTSLEAQAAEPLLNPREHGFVREQDVLARIREIPEYRPQVRAAFGIAPQAVGMEHVGRALAAFERTLLSADSPFDRFQYAGNREALSPAAQRGLALFRGRAQCAACHAIGDSHALFTDHRFHASGIGLDRIAGRLAELAVRVDRASQAERGRMVISDADVAALGRFVATVNPSDIGQFKTPSLRNVAITSPYMHDGSVATLEEAVEQELYYRSVQANRPLVLTAQEKADLVAFLQSLTGAESEGKK